MTPPLRLLVIDDDASIRRLFEEMAAPKLGVEVGTAPDGAAGLEALRGRPFDVVLVDLKMPGMSGLEVIERARAQADAPLMVIMTAFGSIENAVQAVKLGAWDYLVKPFKLSQVERIVNRARRLREPTAEAEPYRVAGLVGEAPAIRAVHDGVGRMRRVECNVLVVGESGTGKELVARALHFEGSRRDGPFVAVDCAAIPPTLMETELFGHARGAFTGATSDRVGLFERANRGTIFLDEIGELPPELQAVLLRAIEERQIRPVGATTYRAIDVRIVAATNRRLDAEVEGGRFRRDLYYRLNVVTIDLPPLRTRKDDIPHLVDHFVRRFEKASGVTREAMHALLRYDWPGNVRELRHAVERAGVMAAGARIEVSHLPEAVVQAARAKGRAAAGKTLRQIEEDALRSLLIEHGGDTARVAASLGVDRSTVYRMARRFGLDVKTLGRT